MDILTLIDKRNNLMDEAEKFLTEKTTKNGGLSDDDAKTYAEMEKNIDAVTENIERFQRQNARNSADCSFTRAPIRPELSGNTNTKVGRASDEYKKAALDAIRTKFKNANNLLQEQVGTDGGYLVPQEWDERLTVALKEKNVFRGLADVITTNSDHNMPFTTNGAAAYWLGEGQAATQSNATFQQKTLHAHKLVTYSVITNELLFDSAFDIEGYILEDFARTLADKEEDGFINGTGALNHQPEGILTTAASDASMVQVTAGANLASDDLINLVYSLQKEYRKNAVFLVNDATLAAVRKLKDNNLACIWQPSYQAGEPDRLLGYPIYTSPFMPTIAAGNMVIAFGDFSYYKIGDRGARAFQQLNELHAPNFMTGYIMTERVDGVLLLNRALRVLKIKP